MLIVLPFVTNRQGGMAERTDKSPRRGFKSQSGVAGVRNSLEGGHQASIKTDIFPQSTPGAVQQQAIFNKQPEGFRLPMHFSKVPR